MILFKNIAALAKRTMYRTSQYSFWKNLSGQFDRFVCNHSYGYAHNVIMGRIGQTTAMDGGSVDFAGASHRPDSLTDFIKYPPIVCIPIKYPG
jgi:hypothetical protein